MSHDGGIVATYSDQDLADSLEGIAHTFESQRPRAVDDPARTRYYTREEAARLGWDVRHPARGGAFLEEQEIVDYFPELAAALGHKKPDFAGLLANRVSTVIECKNDWRDADRAVREAQEYADIISEVKNYDVRLAVGVAGTPDKRVRVRCGFRSNGHWVDLASHGYPLSQLPTPIEVQIALTNGDGTTDVQLPDEREFFSAAISISRILRLAKIEEAIRPKVIGAIVLALHRGDFAMERDVVIENINTNIRAAIDGFTDVPSERRQFLARTLELSTEAHRLRPRIADVVHQLERLNVRSIMRSGVDFLGQFYETFLRYGQDTKKLGIVFTPRHITRFCAGLVDVGLGHTVYDPACGTGGFLVAAYDMMMPQANTDAARRKVKESLFGYDTNSTVWSLAVLNMFFRGDGKSHIIYGDCFQDAQHKPHAFDRALLNPPFSQEGEPEIDFIDHALGSVKPGGRVAVVVRSGVLVDPTLANWRSALVNRHHVEAVLTLPLELFYPTSVPTVVLMVRAHAPVREEGTLVARIENDGYEISKKRRVPIEGSQLEEIAALVERYRSAAEKEWSVPGVAVVVPRDRLLGGEEICAEKWLPAGEFGRQEYDRYRTDALRQLSLAIANYPEITDELLEDPEGSLASLPFEGRPHGHARLSDWFDIDNAASTGAKNYPPGAIPYVSSGDSYNGIVGFVEPPDTETYTEPLVTVSAFGQACLQPWRFCARGNGGSAVRILRPRFGMSVPELLWFIGQINSQRWRFHYGRMASRKRLVEFDVEPPPHDLPDFPPLREKLLKFRRGLDALLDPVAGAFDEKIEDDPLNSPPMSTPRTVVE